MLQKVLKFANYAVAVRVKKIMLIAPAMQKIMLPQSANAYSAVDWATDLEFVARSTHLELFPLFSSPHTN